MTTGDGVVVFSDDARNIDSRSFGSTSSLHTALCLSFLRRSSYHKHQAVLSRVLWFLEVELLSHADLLKSCSLGTARS